MITIIKSGALRVKRSGVQRMLGAISLLAVFVLFTLHTSRSTAFASDAGSTTGELLKIPVGARAIAMGEAYTAAANDSSALQWNPAGLSFAEHKEASFMHSSLIEGVHYEHLGFASPGDNYSYGLSMSYLGYGDIAGYDNTDRATGDVKAYSMILSGGLSSFVYNNLSLGITGSALQQKLAADSAWTMAANVGALYAFSAHPLDANYKLGLSALNLGPGLKVVSDRAPLPRKIKFGAAVEHIKSWPVNFTLDLTKPNDNSIYMGFGSEYWFKQLLALRLGYAGSNDEGQGLRMGVGLKLRQFLFDYAYGSFGDFGATHRVQLAMHWGERVKQLNIEQRKILKDAKRSGELGDYNDEIARLEELLQQDPTNTRVLKQMIASHDKMLANELKEAVALAEPEEIPDPEQMALKELVPGQAMIAKSAALDPLGLENLPDVNNLLPAQPSPLASAPESAPTLHEATEPRQSEPVAPSPSAPAAVDHGDNGVMISPSDIYN